MKLHRMLVYAFLIGAIVFPGDHLVSAETAEGGPSIGPPPVVEPFIRNPAELPAAFDQDFRSERNERGGGDVVLHALISPAQVAEAAQVEMIPTKLPQDKFLDLVFLAPSPVHSTGELKVLEEGFQLKAEDQVPGGRIRSAMNVLETTGPITKGIESLPVDCSKLIGKTVHADPSGTIVVDDFEPARITKGLIVQPSDPLKPLDLDPNRLILCVDKDRQVLYYRWS